MKQIFTLVVLALAVHVSFAQVKSVGEDFKIPNGDYENWYTVTNPVNPGVDYEEIGTGPTDNWMGTLNSLALVPPTNFGPGPITVFKTTDKHGGNYAAKTVSADFPLGKFVVFIPGMIGTAVMDNKSISAIMGKPCPDCRPSKFTGWYKYEPVSGDSCVAFLLLTKWNTTTLKRDTVGFGQMLQKNPVASYEKFEIPINYVSTQPVDSMTLLLVASAGINYNVFTGCKGRAGSTLFVDDLSLDYSSGINHILGSDLSVKVYPNPAVDEVHFDLSREVKNGIIEIFNSAVQPVGTFQLKGMGNSILVTGLASGTYFYRLMSGKDMLNTGAFIVNK